MLQIPLNALIAGDEKAGGVLLPVGKGGRRFFAGESLKGALVLRM